jgi:phosphoribosyl-ATP pyrophosphohydrolase/phosphoribosyl-AMP cyclohydrolase/histidinol dehydrogenase
MTTKVLKLIAADDIPHLRRDAVDADTLHEAGKIVEDVRERGEKAMYEHGVRLGDVEHGEPMVYTREALQNALESLPDKQRGVLERTAERIENFARAQRACLTDLDMDIPGGTAGHTVTPVERAGCYAPGGRFPLPSSVLMTVCTARVAGVETVWVASPRPDQITLAAAAVAGADALLGVGGAQAIAAMAYGAGEVPACDVVVGPGNRWVTAAKKLVSGRVRIDMLAGPSELVVFADHTADPATVAADLLAQAEHDPDALPILISLDQALLQAVDDELVRQLDVLPTKDIASAALENGFAVIANSVAQGIDLCDRIAPEHLELILENSDQVAEQVNHYGGLFVGHGSAEVLGDYGAGPNHTLPTGGTARSTGGLSVFTFLRICTWMEIEDLDDAQELIDDAVELARLEGLEGHARSAERRKKEDEG